MGIVVKPIHELLHVFVYDGVVFDLVGPFSQLVGLGKLASVEQIGHFQKRALFGQLINGVATVLEDPLVTIDKRNGALSRGRILVTRIVRHHAKIVVFDFDLPKSHGIDGVMLDGDFVLAPRAMVRDGDCVFAFVRLIRFRLGLNGSIAFHSFQSLQKSPFLLSILLRPEREFSRMSIRHIGETRLPNCPPAVLQATNYLFTLQELLD